MIIETLSLVKGPKSGYDLNSKNSRRLCLEITDSDEIFYINISHSKPIREPLSDFEKHVITTFPWIKT